MTPTTHRSVLRLPPRGPLALLLAGAIAVAAAARIAGGAHPQPVVLDALLWSGAIAVSFTWYALLGQISDRTARRWRAALVDRETHLATARRRLLVAARGDRFIVSSADVRWPGDSESLAVYVAIAAHTLRAFAAFLLGVAIIAIGMGVPDPIAAESSAPPLAYALSFSLHAIVVSWLDLGWRWLGWRAGLRVVDRARRLLESA